MKAWPVDFAGFASIDEVLDRIAVLEQQVSRGHEDICWAAWEIEQLNILLMPEPLSVKSRA